MESEYLACMMILDFAKKFYQDEKNIAAYEKWIADGMPPLH